MQSTYSMLIYGGIALATLLAIARLLVR